MTNPLTGRRGGENKLRRAGCREHFAQKKNSVPSRPFIFLALLPMLFLSSCEPGDNGSHAGYPDNIRDGKEQRMRLPGDTMNPERIAAQESLGKPPLPRDLSEGIEDECPVHHERMKVREIPIVFEDAASEKTKSAKQPLTAKFPFGAEKIISAGNALLPGEPLSARVYQCASCVAARRAPRKNRRRLGQPNDRAGAPDHFARLAAGRVSFAISSAETHERSGMP